jgi:hypothetical protein
MADVVIFDKEPPPGTPKGAKRSRSDDVEGYVNFIIGIVNKYYKRSV